MQQLSGRHCIGILAHVDAGKTTLSEALLYKTGVISTPGRVDSGDAYLDTDSQERARGITIFSKQARIRMGEGELILVDTPGHVDFSAEMERALQILDVAVLVISGSAGVQPHTRTLWRLLNRYNVPTVVFINKMDMPGTDRDAILKNVQGEMSDGIIPFDTDTETMYDNLATISEELLSEYLDQGVISDESIASAIARRQLFPCIYGSALRLEGVEKILDVITSYVNHRTKTQSSIAESQQAQALKHTKDDELSAYVYKITRDPAGVRLTHIRILAGNIRIKDMLGEEKVNEIRLYSGDKYTQATEGITGDLVAIPGLMESSPGMSYGRNVRHIPPVLEPVLSYAIRYPDTTDRTLMLKYLHELEEELPELHVEYDEEHREIRVSLMGVVQTEVLTNLMMERYGVAVTFDVGHISYKETITDVVEGVGHFEPLRHYAEVHLRLEPAEAGTGLQFDTEVSEDLLDRNWQRLIRTHLEERVHRGVLTGSPITDMKITIVGGRAHNKHTEGGDFRQATYRAVRQGLMQTHSRLLEPYYEYTLELPESMVGRAMTDIDRMNGTAQVMESVNGTAVLCGRGPVATMHTYATEVAAYTRGEGHLMLASGGYAPCHNEEEVVMDSGYNPDADLRNPSASVFCQHGAGVNIPWYEVSEYMHVPSCIDGMQPEADVTGMKPLSGPVKSAEVIIGTDEIDEIIARTAHANRKDDNRTRRKETVVAPKETVYKGTKLREKYLLVDGYNVIFAWQELKELAAVNIDGARGRLLDIISNYQGITGDNIIVVFDAYRLENHKTEFLDYYNIHVVYTRTAETADAYIERFAHEHGRKYDITVATSDGLEQIIIRGQGCKLMSSREFEQRVRQVSQDFKETHGYL